MESEAPITSQLDPDTISVLKELRMNSSPNITTHSTQIRYDAGVRQKFLSAALTGEDLHSEYQIVTKGNSWKDCGGDKMKTLLCA